MDIPILFEDGEALVINKPAGLPLDRARAGGAALDDYLPTLKLGFAREPVAVHRLDRDTSGCLLLARNPKALKRFAKAFEDRLVGKRYLGVVAADVVGDSGTIDLALTKISSAEAGWRMILAKKGKASVTQWKVLDRRNGLTLVEFRPETGRTHQIRVHALHGPGGQNVNKVATAVQLRLDVYALRLPPPVFHRLKELAGSRMTLRGELVLAARNFRTQEANRADARDRRAALLREAHNLPEKRAKSRLNRVGKGARLDSKKKRGTVKAGRGKVSLD